MKSQNNRLQKITKITSLFLVAVLAFSFVSASFSHPAFARRRRRNSAAERRELERKNQNIKFPKFEGTYKFSANQNGDTDLEVTEQISASFILGNVNHGIERAIPKYYNGKTVFDGKADITMDGINVPYSTRPSNDNVVFRIGDSNQYVSGRHNYQIKYHLKNILRAGEGELKDRQLLIVNANGSQWQQQFGEVSGKVILDQSVKNEFKGIAKCFSGAYGSDTQCEKSSLNQENGEYTFSEKNVLSNQSVTFLMAFNNKFAQPTPNPLDVTTMIVAIVSMIAALVIVALATIVFYRKNTIRKRNSLSKEAKTVVPQYLPPKIGVLDILDAGNLVKSNKKVTAAMLFFAVNGNILIEEEEKKNLFGKHKIYKIKLLNYRGLNSDMRELLECFFIDGEEVNLSKTMSSSIASSISSRIINDGFKDTDYYDQSEPAFNKRMRIVAYVIDALIFASFFFSDSTFSALSTVSKWHPYIFLSTLIAGVFSTLIIVVVSIKIPSRKGYEMKNYLMGLKLYISVAESERLKYLQSLEKSERFKDEFGGSRVKLYEKLLPWAALFGLEKSWAKVLEVEFANNDYQPSWYSGVNAFNAAVFADTLNSFSSAVNSYSAPSSGGAGGGGGFSGGGAGGGGGGGW